MTIDGLLIEAQEAEDRCWFVQTFKVAEQTDFTITLHFVVGRM